MAIDNSSKKLLVQRNWALLFKYGYIFIDSSSRAQVDGGHAEMRAQCHPLFTFWIATNVDFP
jgi:hypothetical protein